MAADFVRPMMIRQPPALGSKAPVDIAGILKEAGRIAGMSQRDVQNLVRIFTMSRRRLARLACSRTTT